MNFSKAGKKRTLTGKHVYLWTRKEEKDNLFMEDKFIVLIGPDMKNTLNLPKKVITP